MEIIAKGKNIPTFAFSNLFTEGEKFSDTICFRVGRCYEGNELSDCSFLMRGVNEKNEEAQQAIIPEIYDDFLVLKWRVSEYFTAVAGKLELELRAVCQIDGGETLILKYAMQPVYVRESVAGENLPVPDTVEQVLNEISSAVSEGLEEIQLVIDDFDLSEVEERLDRIEADTAVYLARPEVIPVSRSEYKQIPHKKNALYVIIKE